MSKVVSTLGGLIGISPKKAPQVSAASIQDVADDKKKVKKSLRSKLFATAGGATGQELQAGQVSTGRTTFFGN